MTEKNRKNAESTTSDNILEMEFCASPQHLHNHRHRVKVITTQRLAAEIKHRKKSEGFKYKTEAKRKCTRECTQQLEALPNIITTGMRKLQTLKEKQQEADEQNTEEDWTHPTSTEETNGDG